MERSASATASEGHRAAAARTALIALALAGCHAIFGLDEVPARNDAAIDAATVDAPCGGHDEDLDGIADNCDSCPHVVDLGVDTDGDKVDDACDPHKTVSGDRLAAFYAFVPGEPMLELTATTFANVVRGNDELVATAGSNKTNEETLALVPDLSLAQVTVIARATVTMVGPPAMGYANSTGLWAQVTGPGTRPTLPLGLDFEGYESNSMTGQVTDYVHVFDTVGLAKMEVQTPTTIEGTLDYRLYCDEVEAPTCTGYLGSGGLMTAVEMPGGYDPPGGRVGLRTLGVARTAWQYLVVYSFGDGR